MRARGRSGQAENNDWEWTPLRDKQVEPLLIVGLCGLFVTAGFSLAHAFDVEDVELLGTVGVLFTTCMLACYAPNTVRAQILFFGMLAVAGTLMIVIGVTLRAQWGFWVSLLGTSAMAGVGYAIVRAACVGLGINQRQRH